MKLLDFIQVITLPLIPLYWVPIKLRNVFFDIGLFRQQKVEAKIVSVGNITVGGSGKTPMSIYVIKTLQSMNKKVAALSRGYGRDTKGFREVSDGVQMFTGAQNSGDEMYLTALECNCPAGVSESRVEGALNLIKNYKPDVIVLDDAFQHRWLKRDLDIVLFDQRFLMQNNRLHKMSLPAGHMRESFSALDRADCVVINRKFSDKADADRKIIRFVNGKKIFHAHYNALGFIDVRNGRHYNPDDFRGQISLAVCGIASPHSFFNALDSMKISAEQRLVFKDHKRYNNAEVQKIRKEFYAKNCYSVVTTQKDAVKLMQFKEELDDIDIYYLKIELEIEEREEFIDYMKAKLFAGNSKIN